MNCPIYRSGPLGGWIVRQRELKRAGRLLKDWEDVLNSIAFVWNGNTKCQHAPGLLQVAALSPRKGRSMATILLEHNYTEGLVLLCKQCMAVGCKKTRVFSCQNKHCMTQRRLPHHPNVRGAYYCLEHWPGHHKEVQEWYAEQQEPL